MYELFIRGLTELTKYFMVFYVVKNLLDIINILEDKGYGKR